MRKLFDISICILLLLAFTVGVMAADGPVITAQPQSPEYSEYAVAIYTVKAEGSNLYAYWYMQWEGVIYPISERDGGMQPWEAYAGEAYGPSKPDDNTFCFIFEGIGSQLNGAEIWCVIEDGHNDVTSQKAKILVRKSGEPSPPNIQSMPTQLVVEQGQPAEIRCIANSTDGSQLTFCWYETDTGRMEDMRAVNRGEETTDYLFCDTTYPGTRNYLCKVESTNGGVAYSSIVAITVTAKATPMETTPPETKPAETAPPETKPVETAPVTTAAPETTPETTEAAPTEDTVKPTRKPKSPKTRTEESENQLSPWVILLVAVLAAGAGVITAVLLVRKNKN